MILITSVNSPRLKEVKEKISELEAELTKLRVEEHKLERLELTPGKYWRAKSIGEVRYRLVKILGAYPTNILTDQGEYYYDRVVFKRSEHE